MIEGHRLFLCTQDGIPLGGGRSATAAMGLMWFLVGALGDASMIEGACLSLLKTASPLVVVACDGSHGVDAVFGGRPW